MRTAPYMSLILVLIILTMAASLLPSATARTAHEPKVGSATLGGQVHMDVFHVEERERVIVAEDLRVVCAHEAIVDGLIVAHSGVTVEIIAPSIIVRGMIRAGDGENATDVLGYGQSGGSVILDSHYILLDDALLQGGHGGNGGPSGNAGHGGDVYFYNVIELVARHSLVRAGTAGHAGDGMRGFGDAALDGGYGGNGGNAWVYYVQKPVETHDLQPEWLNRELERAAASGGCTSGSDGADGVDVVAGDGTNGGNGANGESGMFATRGGNGQPGGNGGHAGATDGGMGQDGDDCCPLPGGYGGHGGKGGNAFAGDGGSGGNTPPSIQSGPTATSTSLTSGEQRWRWRNVSKWPVPTGWNGRRWW